MREYNTKHINKNLSEIFKSKSRKLIVFGGAGSGKSYAVADKIIYRSITESNLSILVIRKTFPSLRNTCMKLLKERSKRAGVDYEINNQTQTATIGRDCTIYYLSCNDEKSVDKIQSMTDVDMVWIEEATDLRYSDYRKIKDRMRGGQDTYKQIILTFNPVSKFNWIYKTFFQENKEEAEKIHYTVMDNQYLIDKDPNYIEELKAYKETDFNHYKIYYLGEWGELSGIIYKNWKIGKAPKVYDEIIYGLDFGFSESYTALVKIYRTGNEYFTVQQMIYEKGLITSDLIKKMNYLKIEKNANIYADGARPESIEEIKRAHYNIFRADKNSATVIEQIDYIKSLDMTIEENSEDIITEQKSYIWKVNSDGDSLNEPIKQYDHACLSGDTLIDTDKGKKRIDSILIGDKVLTRKGFKKVLDSGCTGIKETYEYSIDGKSLIATPDHRVITENGKIEIDRIVEKDRIYTLSKMEVMTWKKQSIAVNHVDKKPYGKIKVFNLTIEDEHEFYANDILVSNCDAIRYGIFTHTHKKEKKKGRIRGYS